jgi:hypothetical protein
MSKLNGRGMEDTGFLEEQLFEAQRCLFAARSVKEAKFLSNRITFLKQQLKQGNGRKK